MNLVKVMMPQTGRSEGVWEGTYIYTDPEGRELDRHSSRLTHAFPEDAPNEYHQRNQYTWQDGRTEDLRFKFVLQVNELVFETDRSYGRVWDEPVRVGELASVRVSWHRTEVQGYSPYDVPHATIHELIQMDKDFVHRGRVWQWFAEGELIGRTIIKEKRVS